MLSGTGRYCAFSSESPPIAGGTSGQSYIKDTCAGVASGCTPKLALISVDAQGTQQPFASGALGSSGIPAMSGDGHCAAYVKLDQVSDNTQDYLNLTGF